MPKWYAKWGVSVFFDLICRTNLQITPFLTHILDGGKHSMEFFAQYHDNNVHQHAS